MVDVPVPSLDLTVVCNECGEDLPAEWSDRMDRLQVDPCPVCTEASKETGDGEGYKRGYDDGHSDGKEEATQ